jgi:hypothetical protein
MRTVSPTSRSVRVGGSIPLAPAAQFVPHAQGYGFQSAVMTAAVARDQFEVSLTASPPLELHTRSLGRSGRVPTSRSNPFRASVQGVLEVDRTIAVEELAAKGDLIEQ